MIIPPIDNSKSDGRPIERKRFVLVKPLVVPQPELNELKSNVTNEPSAQVQTLREVENIIWFD